jgi:cell division protein FtsB
MDLFTKLSDDTKQLLWLSDKSGKGIVDQITQLHQKHKLLTKLEIIRKIKKPRLSIAWVKGLPVNAVTYEDKTNPFKTALWKKMKTVNKFKNNNSDVQVSVPPEKDLNSELSENIAYVVPGYTEAGSFADAKTLVAYNGHLCVIKSSGETARDEILFEIITQAYLFEQIQNRPLVLEQVKADVKQQKDAGAKAYVPAKVVADGAIYKKIKVPELFFVQRFAEEEDDGGDRVMIDVEKVYNVDICMHRAEGVPLKILGTSRLMIALAHVCKALWHLQRDFHFMHRDLSGHNVFFDYASKIVTFIDFGMSCVNPDLHQGAWQSGNVDFYKKSDEHASKCTNESLDICILISFLTHFRTHAWCNAELVEMKKKMKETIASSENEAAKAKLTLTPGLKAKLERIKNTVLTDEQRRLFTQKAVKKAVAYGQSYTALDYGEGKPGNLAPPSAGRHWWLFNLVEFPVEYYYPANVLTRLLYEIPLKEWFAIRANWTDTFDAAMPKNIRIGIKDGVAIEQLTGAAENVIGKEGLLIKLYKTNQLVVEFGDFQYNLDIEICERIV